MKVFITLGHAAVRNPELYVGERGMENASHSRCTIQSMENTIELVKSLSKGPCGCQYNMGSFGVSWDSATGEQKSTYDRGPRTTHCIRCRAREALDADDIEYEKDDRRQWEPWMTNLKTSCATPEYTQVITGSLNLGFHNKV